VLPNLILYYMHKTTQQHSGATERAARRTVAAAPGGAPGSKAAGLSGRTPTSDEDSDSRTAVQAKGSSAESNFRVSGPGDLGTTQAMQSQGTAFGEGAGQSEGPPAAPAHSMAPATAAAGRTTHAAGVLSNRTPRTVSQKKTTCRTCAMLSKARTAARVFDQQAEVVHKMVDESCAAAQVDGLPMLFDHDSRRTQVGSLGHGSPASAEVQRAVQNAHALMRRASPHQTYRSRLVQPQVLLWYRLH
jgi:hypothetical protein